ncbi:MAG: protein-glutamate O-methyltransferase [Pseudomonadota bacterium]
MNAIAPMEGLSDREFDLVISVASQDAGLAIPKSKKSLVQSRVARRMREKGVTDRASYFRALEVDKDERSELIYVLTTNVSHFYREPHHFEFIREQILERPNPQGLRLWSAGCSNGQEPYTLALEILTAIPDAAKSDILILASDIDPNVLAKAKSGVYSESEIEGVPKVARTKLFQQVGDQYHIRKEVAELVRFRSLNLNSEWPMKGQFDVILCRNVVIYFDEKTQRTLWSRFAEKLVPNGVLMLGHSERIHPLEGTGFESIGVTTYRKV